MNASLHCCTLLAIVISLAVLQLISADDLLIGWSGESYNRSTQIPHNKTWTEVLSWQPRAYMYHNFLTDAECEHLIQLAKPRVLKSTVVDSSTGGSVSSNARTSSGTFLQRGMDEVVTEIERKIAEITMFPVQHGEPLHILRYDPGEKYDPHHDYFYDELNTKNGGQRAATLLMYLSDVEEGGETVFPNGKPAPGAPRVAGQASASSCTAKGLVVVPEKRAALLFYGMTPDFKLDPSSLHGGCPVISGEKWSATKWLRQKAYI